jgi:lambda family phage minor tail protein L
MTVPVEELQSVAPSAIIELFVLELNAAMHGVNDIYRFHAGTNAVGNNDNVVWAGNTYQAMPIEAEGFEYSGNGQLPRPKIRVSNIMGTITSILLSLPSGLEGAKVSRIRTMARYLDAVNFPGATNPYGTPDSTAEFPREIYYIDRKSIENRDVVEYEMCSAFDLIGVRAPKRQCIANICQWVYRSTECGYNKAGYYDANNNPVGSLALDVCGKRLDSCQTRFNVFTKIGTVTAGSNIWTTASTTSILPGDPIRGFGLPAGTTVNTVASSTTLTLSANSTATSNLTKTGTASTTGAFLTVTNATGLAVGHKVTGTYMNDASITGINGLTLNLSTRPYSIYKTGTWYEGIIDIPSGTSDITVGMYVYGSFSSATDTVAEVGSTYVVLDTGSRVILPDEVAEGTPVSVYFMPASPTALTYTFSADTTYSFRDPANTLPFGSFPGVGAYTQ